jgi:hypothetical protein
MELSIRLSGFIAGKKLIKSIVSWLLDGCVITAGT